MSSVTKKVLRGFSDLSIFAVQTNDSTSYVLGERVAVPGAQELSVQKDTNEWKIYADDGIYESGTDWKGAKLALTIAGLPSELRNYFEGGFHSVAKGTYTYFKDSEAPEIALSFGSFANSEMAEFTKIFSLRCTKVSFEHKTKGENTSVIPVKIEGVIMQRKIDGAVFAKKEGPLGDNEWIYSNDGLVITP